MARISINQPAKNKDLHEKQINLILFLYGKRYIDFFSRYTLRTLLKGRNENYLRNSTIHICVSSRSEVIRLSKVLKPINLSIKFYFLQKYTIDNTLKDLHSCFWEDMLHKLEGKVIFIVPDQIYESNALQRMIESLDNFDSYTYKSYYVLENKNYLKRFVEKKVITKNDIFKYFYDWSHPVLMAWFMFSNIYIKNYELSLYKKNNNMVWQPINQHIYGINLKNKIKTKDYRNLDQIISLRKKTTFLHNVSVSCEGLGNHFNEIKHSAKSNEKILAFKNNLLNIIKRRRLNYPEINSFLIFSGKNYHTKTIDFGFRNLLNLFFSKKHQLITIQKKQTLVGPDINNPGINNINFLGRLNDNLKNVFDFSFYKNHITPSDRIISKFYIAYYDKLKNKIPHEFMSKSINQLKKNL